MRQQVIGSIAVGLFVTAIAFIPILIWQYRRYGRFDALRMVWLSAAFIYFAAIVAFTVFPLPHFSPTWCARYATTPLWDPLRFFKSASHVLAADGWRVFLRSSVLWEVCLNMALFIPFGVIVRRVWEVRRRWVVVSAFAVSLLIELTQLTGNWGLAPCSYRYFDTTDLATNTTGAVIGLGLEALLPRFLQTSAHLRARRNLARPVRRFRRLIATVLDMWFMTLATAVVATGVVTVFLLVHDRFGHALTAAEDDRLQAWLVPSVLLAALAVWIVPLITGTGATLGERTVYLQPTSKAARIIRGVCYSAAITAVPFLPGAIMAVALAGLIHLVVVLIAPQRGLTALLSGSTIVDSRAQYRQR